MNWSIWTIYFEIFSLQNYNICNNTKQCAVHNVSAIYANTNWQCYIRICYLRIVPIYYLTIFRVLYYLYIPYNYSLYFTRCVQYISSYLRGINVFCGYTLCFQISMLWQFVRVIKFYLSLKSISTCTYVILLRCASCNRRLYIVSSLEVATYHDLDYECNILFNLIWKYVSGHF